MYPNYPPSSGGYPPQPGGYPQQPQPQPQAYGGYPATTNYPPATGGYPPPAGGGGYPPQQPQYGMVTGPAPTQGYPQGNYPQQQQQQYPQPNPPQAYPNQPYGGGQTYQPQMGGGYPPQQQQQPHSQYPAPPQPVASQYPSQPSMSYPSTGGGYPSQQPPSGYPAPQPGGYPSGYPSQQPTGYPAQPTYGGGAYPNMGVGGAAPNMYQQGGQSNYMLTPVMSSTMQFQGTVVPAPNFNANLDAESLKKAMRGFGCDDRAVMNILAYRSNAQRQQIRQMFRTMYGKDLIQELISELTGHFEDLIVALLYTPEEFDARELQHAMAGTGTTESTLIEIMVTRTNAEINAIKAAFRRLYGKELDQALSNETSGHFKRLLISLSVGGRDESNYVDRARAAAQARDLYQAGEKQWGTSESVFNATMVATNPVQLQVVFEEYQKLTGHDVEQAVKGEFSGDIEDGLLTVVKCVKNKPAYFAERAYQAMRGMGTNDRALIRVIVSRCEKDMVQVKQEYQRMYKTTLEAAINSDTSGKYKEGLLALIHGR